ncbi:hypothetical protein S7711_06733 [Stachybotrys chartarum IBT 7711]|uniref:Uncharacterized protein n=1 Tax=Stachybotrys chartarum (strain CBS 109288 / IBT 7711) TaxID=1280523 RepID=A0A084B5S3_STACB|nr:hypothetical protein S7711_06733 [Stachybotrys chartarum IBT 7711]KFA53526.1 hypothetical protein S40293_06539 [Stachybotrys chartarum IBT 40293]
MQLKRAALLLSLLLAYRYCGCGRGTPCGTCDPGSLCMREPGTPCGPACDLRGVCVEDAPANSCGRKGAWVERCPEGKLCLAKDGQNLRCHVPDENVDCDGLCV